MLPLIAKFESTRLVLAHRFGAFIGNRSGATAIEYGLIAAGIAVAIIGVVFALGDELDEFFGGIQTQLNSKQPS